MSKKSNIYSIIFIVLFVIILISGVTFAIYTWQTLNDDEDVYEGVSTCFDIVYSKGSDIGSNENSRKLSLGKRYSDGLSTSLRININSKCKDITGIGTLYLNTEEETSDYLLEDGILNYYVSSSGTSSSGVIDSKGSIPIYSDFIVDQNSKNITVYVWVNGANVTNENVEQIINGIYKGNITASVESR